MKILDACCDSKMFWFDRQHKETVYMDNRTGNTSFVIFETINHFERGGNKCIR